MKKIIMVLGSPNDTNGNLGQVAKDRLECALNLYNNNKDIKILCTGGFGEHFNATSNPHALYAKRYLMGKGVSEEDFLEFALSANTFEDFEKSRPILEKEKYDVLIVVTSDFHMQRVKIIYNKTLKQPNVLFVSARSTVSQSQFKSLSEHEKNAINKIN